MLSCAAASAVPEGNTKASLHLQRPTTQCTIIFTSLAEAREFLVVYSAGNLNLERKQRLEPQYYIRILREWSAALDSLLQSRNGTDITAAAKRAISLLKLYERYCVLRLQQKSSLGYLDSAESPAVCIEQVIEELVKLAASALGMEAVEDDTRMQPQGKPILHLEDLRTHLSHEGSRNREFVYGKRPSGDGRY